MGGDFKEVLIHESSASYGGKIHCTFTWKLKDFVEQNEELESEEYEIDFPDGQVTYWKLVLFPESEENNGYITLFLEKLEESPSDFDEISPEIGFCVTSTGTGANAVEKDIVKSPSSPRTFSRDENTHGVNLGCKSSELIGETVTIKCCIDITVPESVISKKNPAPLSKRIHSGLSEDYLNLFNSGTHSDVEIICGEKTFQCHKSILSARSPVFRAMFKLDMEEKKKGKVEIIDYTPIVIDQMLYFIYTGGLQTSIEFDEEAQDNFEELLRAADQYQIEMLKEACEDSLCSNLEVDNCLISLIIGDMYKTEKLKKFSMEMFLKNMKSVLAESPEDWKKCVKKYPDLTVEITEELAKVHCSEANK